MSEQPPVFLLKVAEALVNEVAVTTDSVLTKARQEKDREGFLDGLRGAFTAGALVYQLQRDLQLALKLCETAAKADPGVALDDGTTPAAITAKVLFQQGLIAYGEKKFKEAVGLFEQSLRYAISQTTYYNIGECLLQMKGLFHDTTADAVKAFQQCINLNLNTEIAIEAGKQLARLEAL